MAVKVLKPSETIKAARRLQMNIYRSESRFQLTTTGTKTRERWRVLPGRQNQKMNDLIHLLSMHLQGRERSRVNCSSCDHTHARTYTHTQI